MVFVGKKYYKCFRLKISGKTSWFILFSIVTSCLDFGVEAIHGPSVDNWCSEKYCKNCAKSESLRCSENAFSSSYGDLCGCCQSCVHLRDLGETCGSQLAVRSSASENFGDARSRVTIIATSNCKRGLVCIYFLCHGKNEAVDAEVELHGRISNIENGFPELRDLPADVIKLKNQSQFGYQHNNRNEVKYPSADEYEDSDDALVRKITTSTFTAKSLPSLTEMLSKLGSHENKVSNIWKSVMPALQQNMLFSSSRRFLNFIIDDREFQLIYGHDALDDLKILLNSVDKSQPNSIVNELEAQTIYERFKNLLDYINNKKDKSVTKEETSLHLRSVERAKNLKNEGTTIFGDVLRSKKFSLLKNNKLAGISNTDNPQLFAGQLQSKRETEDAENSEVYLRMQNNNVDTKEQVNKRANREFPVHDSVNTPLGAMENVNKEVTENVPYSMGFPLLHRFLFARIPNTRTSGFRTGGFRKKRETNDAEESKVHIEPQYKNSEEQNVYEIVNTKQINKRAHNEFTDNDFAYESSDTMEKVNEKINDHSMGFLKDTEEFKVIVEPEYKNVKQPNFHNITNPNEKTYEKSNAKFPVSYLGNETPRTMENVDHHWRIATEKGAGDKLPIDERIELGATETVMNIHVTGLPRPGNTAEDLGVEVKSRKHERGGSDESVEEDYGRHDVGLEIFVTDANGKVSDIEAEEDLYNFENFTKVEESKSYKKAERDNFDNVTENLASQTLQFSGNIYQFTFPKTLESDLLRKLSIRINDTVEEFRGRLDRIETKVVAIASSIFNHFFEIRSNEESGIAGESEDPSVSMKANPVGRQLETMNTQSLSHATSEKADQFTEIPAMSRQTKWTRFPKGNSTGKAKRSHWRDFMVPSSFPEIPTDLRGRSRRPNGMRDNGGHFPQRNSRRKIITRFPVVVEKKFPDPPDLTTRKWFGEDTPKFSAQFTSPVIWSDADYRHFSKYSPAFVQKNEHTSKVFAGEQSNYGMDSDPVLDSTSIPNQKNLWPLNPAWKRGERNKRISTPESSAIEEAIFSLETQIPKPVRSRLSRVFGHQLGGRSLGLRDMVPMITSTMTNLVNNEFSGQFEDDGRNLEPWAAEPSINLFIVEDNDSKFEVGEPLEAEESSQGFVLPVKMVQAVKTQRSREVDDNWDPIYPEYLDYAEETQKDENRKVIAEVGTTKIPKNHWESQRIDLGYHDRKKRNVESSLQQENGEGFDFWKKTRLNDVSKNLDANTASVNEDNLYRPIFSRVFGNINKKSSGHTISTSKLSRNRKKRSVQMVDWLRAAQEYHERLHQIRTAALKTWLVSQDELDPSNLTNIKLFTREIPAYLEKYTPTYMENDQSNEGSVEGKIYSVVNENAGVSMTNDDELFAKMVADLSSNVEDRSKENAEESLDQNPKISSSSLPRKFTIFTTGNSAIKIEDMPKMIKGGFESPLDNQSEQDSLNSEVLAHGVDFMPSESEIFDHMYESIDAEDEDFDYGDPRFTISRLMDEVDIVDDDDGKDLESGFEATSEDSFDKDENVEVGDEDDDIVELFTRTKRNSPFFLFKVKRSPAEDVVIWPSNWQHLINRHLKFNRSRSSATQPQKGTRRSYVKLSKVIPKPVATLETSAKSFSTRGPSSSTVSGWR